MADGLIARQRVEVLARLLLSAAIEAALLIAQAGDQPGERAATRESAEHALLELLNGLRRPAL